MSLSDLLTTDNRYGNTTITHWNKNEVSIRVEIEAKAESDDAAQATLDRVQVEIKKSGKHCFSRDLSQRAEMEREQE